MPQSTEQPMSMSLGGGRPPHAGAGEPRDRPETRRGGEAIRFAIGACSLGAFLVAQSAGGLSAVLLGDDRDALRGELRGRLPSATLIEDDARLASLVAEVRAFVDAPSVELRVSLDLRGTPFQREVWQALREIPPGSTATYAEIAERIGRPAAVRAVAQACAANALAVVVPCHRVLRSDGGLSGYRWGVERKRALLDREAGR